MEWERLSATQHAELLTAFPIPPVPTTAQRLHYRTVAVQGAHGIPSISATPILSATIGSRTSPSIPKTKNPL